MDLMIKFLINQTIDNVLSILTLIKMPKFYELLDIYRLFLYFQIPIILFLIFLIIIEFIDKSDNAMITASIFIIVLVVIDLLYILFPFRKSMIKLLSYNTSLGIMIILLGFAIWLLALSSVAVLINKNHDFYRQWLIVSLVMLVFNEIFILISIVNQLSKNRYHFFLRKA